jgi:predicted amidohydrolase
MTLLNLRLAIGQIAMHWTTDANVAAIGVATGLAQARGAALCAFSELAVTGFHRQIAREARPESVLPAVRRLQAQAAHLGIAIAAGCPDWRASDATPFVTIERADAALYEAKRDGRHRVTVAA